MWSPQLKANYIQIQSKLYNIVCLCMIQMKGCIKVLRYQPPNSVEGLLNALRSVSFTGLLQYDRNPYKTLFLPKTMQYVMFFIAFKHSLLTLTGTQQNIWTMRLPPSKSKTCYKLDCVCQKYYLSNTLDETLQQFQ